MLITVSLFPAIISANKISKALYLQRLQYLYTLMVWMAISIALPMTFLSEWLVVLLYGENFRAAGKVLSIHIWSGVFVFLGVAFSKYLMAENLSKKSLQRTVAGVLVNVLLNYILIPIYGITGAAVATLVGQVVANYLYDFFDKTQHEHLRIKNFSFFPIYLYRGQ
jgi:O-antigen/teichoic acid export membrane protein